MSITSPVAESKDERKEAQEKAYKQYVEVTDSLVEFVKRASQEGASSEEIAVLPQVAEIIINRI